MRHSDLVVQHLSIDEQPDCDLVGAGLKPALSVLPVISIMLIYQPSPPYISGTASIVSKNPGQENGGQ